MNMVKPIALVVEDDEDIATLAATALESAGFEAETFADGESALARLEQVVPALVLLDLNLPGVSGTEVLETIRASARLEDVRVILATADPVTAEPLEEKADLVLLKPFSFDQLHDFGVRMASTLT
jgi:DNA-binding response OmpR family regulator